MRQFLRRKAKQQVGMLTALRARLERDRERRPDELPDKEWCRVARLYQDGYRHLATLELETAKVRLMAERAHVRAPMSDEAYQRELEALGPTRLERCRWRNWRPSWSGAALPAPDEPR